MIKATLVSKFIMSAAGALAALMLLVGLAQAGSTLDLDENGVALQGYDPVAYFGGSATKGDANLSASHGEATYHFSSEDNLAAFEAEPEKYLPQYGGFCAFGTTFSQKVNGDPTAFKVVDGKLYINSSPDIQTRWEEDAAGNIEKADAIWPTIKDN